MRSQEICEKLIAADGEDQFRESTGLPVSPYFSGTKVCIYLYSFSNMSVTLTCMSLNATI